METKCLQVNRKYNVIGTQVALSANVVLGKYSAESPMICSNTWNTVMCV